MNVDPFIELQYRFKYDFNDKRIADLIRPESELIGGPESAAEFIAYMPDEFTINLIHHFDLVLLRDVTRAQFEHLQGLAWRVLKPGGILYIGSQEDMKPHFLGWQFYTSDITGDDLHTLYRKTIPGTLPFRLGTTADSALFIIRKTDRKTKREPRELGVDKNGRIVQWFLKDCTLYFRRVHKFTGYSVFDIGPVEREQESVKNGKLAMESIGG